MQKPVQQPDADDDQEEVVPGLDWSQGTGSTPSSVDHRVQRPDLRLAGRVELVHEPPDDAGGDEADRQRQEDHGLDCSHSGRGRRGPRQQARARPTNGGRRTTQSEVVPERDRACRLAEEADEVVEADERVPRRVLEAADDGRDRRVDEEDAQERQGRRDPQPRPKAPAPQRRGASRRIGLDQQDVAEQDGRARPMTTMIAATSRGSSGCLRARSASGWEWRPADRRPPRGSDYGCRRSAWTVSRFARMESRSARVLDVLDDAPGRTPCSSRSASGRSRRTGRSWRWLRISADRF